MRGHGFFPAHTSVQEGQRQIHNFALPVLSDGQLYLSRKGRSEYFHCMRFDAPNFVCCTTQESARWLRALTTPWATRWAATGRR